jgi:Polyketide cyclase / dehydrase and lipid transport
MSPWTVAAEQTLTEEVPAAPDAVRNFYTDLNNMTLVHPLVVAVRSTARCDNADGYTQSYRVRDRIPLGPFTIPTVYSVRLRVPRAGDVISQARQFPRVRLTGTVTFEPVEGGTRVIERLRIQAPRPLAGVTVREAVKAHITMLAGIHRYFAKPE